MQSDDGTTYEDIFFVLSLDGSDDSGGNHGLLPRFGQVEVEDAISSAIVYVRFHLRVAVLGSDVHLSTNKDHKVRHVYSLSRMRF